MHSLLPREGLLGLVKRLSTQLDEGQWPEDYLGALQVLMFDGKPYDHWASETWRTIPLSDLSQAFNFKQGNSLLWLNSIGQAESTKLVHDVAMALHHRRDGREHYQPARDIGAWLKPVIQKYPQIGYFAAEKLPLTSHCAWAMLLEAGWRPSEHNLPPEKLIFPANNMDIDPRSFYLALLKDPAWEPGLTNECWGKLLKAANTFYDHDSYEMLSEKYVEHEKEESINMILNGVTDTDQPFCWLKNRLKNAPLVLSYCKDVDAISIIFRTMERHAPQQLQKELTQATPEALQKVHASVARGWPELASIILEEQLKRQANNAPAGHKSKI